MRACGSTVSRTVYRRARDGGRDNCVGGRDCKGVGRFWAVLTGCENESDILLGKGCGIHFAKPQRPQRSALSSQAQDLIDLMSEILRIETYQRINLYS